MIVFGDIHGCYPTFRKLYDHVKSLYPDEQVVVAGDIPDRGPLSRQVFDFVIENQIPALLGNHELMMRMAHVDRHTWGTSWLKNGGLRTLQSYCTCHTYSRAHRCEGIVALEKHCEFIKSLPLYLEFPELKHQNGRHLVISHAPIVRAGELATLAQHHDFVWERGTPHIGNPWFNIHGHTPVDSVEISSWYANVDTGACYTNRPLQGKLTCLRFPQMEVFQQQNID
jgi:serine/threonine protein phosphatase 1